MVKKVIDISSDRAGGISMTFLKMNKRKVLANKEARPESHSCHLLYSNEQNRRIFRDSPSARRGVAQPGRAPGSGPGGRRFKSSLPDQLSLAISIDYGDISAACFRRFSGHSVQPRFHRNSRNQSFQ